MDSLIYSLNATVPVFLVILAGYLLRWCGMLTDEFVRVANRFNFTVTLPALLLRDIAGADIRRLFDGRYVLFCAVVTTVSFFGIWFGARKLLRDRAMVGAFVQASFRSSAAVLGIAFIQNVYGDAGMAPLMIIGTVPLYNIYSVLVLTFEGPADARDRGRVRAACVGIAKNPIILSIAAGLLLSLTGIAFPPIVDKTVGSLASMATPLALIAIGAGFEGRQAIAKWKPAALASSLKLVVLAALFLPLAVWLGFRDGKLMALLIMLASPATPSCYIMAKNMGGDGTLTSSVVVLTTLLSAFTLTGWIFLLRAGGWL